MSCVRTSGLIIAALAVAFTFSSAASAQQGRGGFGGGMRMTRGADAIFMLQVEPVQKELKLTDDQLDVVEDAGELWTEQSRQLFGNLRDLSQEERREKMQEARPAAEKKAKEVLSKIESKLDESQKTRLHQLVLQQRGALGALQDPDLQGTLKMTDEQKKQIETLAEQNRGGFGQGGRGNANNDEDRQARLEAAMKARDERNQKALDVLTSEQKSEFEKMQGEKFDFPRRPGGGGRGNAG